MSDIPGLPMEALRRRLADRGILDDATILDAELVDGGRSNLTYRLFAGDICWALRRPPLGHVLETAHDMNREYRVQAALRSSAVPVPTPIMLCEDVSVLGAPFYIMEWVDGSILRSATDTARLNPAQKLRTASMLMQTLSLLHAVDYESMGLGDLGTPEGYLARQVRRWGKQLDRSRSRQLQGIEELRGLLARSVPEESSRATLLHGDFRLDNLIVDEPGLHVRAVLDWEMATIGDPMADLGLVIVYWDGLASFDNPILEGVGPRFGFPSGSELACLYADLTGADLDTLGWCTALGYFKLAVIIEGIHFRHQRGDTVGSGFADIGRVVEPLVARGLRILA